MTNNKGKIGYIAFGLNILSEIAFPELQKEDFDYTSTDIEVKDLGFSDEQESSICDNFVINEDLVIFRVPNVAIFSVLNGNQITINKFKDVNEDQLRLYLLGTCMGTLLTQRKYLSLHGSAIEINGKAYAIVGDSGAGKSTLAAAFLHKGYKLISDDVIPVSFNEDNIPMVTPAYPQQKLWQQSLDNFGMESSNLRPVVDRETKFAVPVVNQFCNEQLPLAGVIELVKTADENIQMEKVQNLARLQTLFTHTYRNFLLEPLGLFDWHFHTTTNLASKVDVYRLERPTTQFTAHDLADLILSTIKKEST
ncbi:HPr kinase/phosphorylase [Fredinandcohnia sp. 179-A 10B2 NHS]|uniref:HPr kinase/phosphorylase n=1 Tax=Fredinandcohnia sp. 179-A 10B2 NHS TaxID=3235176 RepID=UPI0039A20DCA